MRWGDKLTSYGAVSFTYDEMGNPLTYFNGKMYAFTWKNGRQLATAYPGGNYNLSFEYNDEGIRTRKTVSGVVHDYILNGSQIVGEKIGGKLLLYIYDAEGMPIGMQYRNISYAEGEFDTYWFEKNLQGDIIAVYDATGTKLISYTYDAWGNCTTTYHNGGASTTATNNPFRYRGYYLDTETGFYYLNSRYYDPVIGRFINADSFISTGQGILSCNMFTYCLNDPINNFDPIGSWTISLSLSLSAVCWFGVSFNIGFAFDDQGNFDWQYSYSVPLVDDTMMVGALSVGGGVSVQYTSADTVYDLYGSASYGGANGGAGWYVGGDVVSFSDVSDPDATIDGFQIVGGYGIGVDVHVGESYTRPLFSKK